MRTNLSNCYMRFAPLVLVFLATSGGPACAANVTWIGGNADWLDGVGNNANWSPADEPDADDAAIFNTADAVNLGSNNSILALTMSGSTDLATNGFDLDVDGLVQLTAGTTNLIVGGSDSLLTADSITINSGANLELSGGAIQINEEAGNGLLDINAGGELVGHGTLSMTDAVAAGTTLIINDGAITARRDPLTIFGAPQVGTLSISATDADARIDLDGAGAGEDGIVNVNRNQTLDLNIPLADLFAGAINLFHQATYDSSSGWGMNGGTINVDSGFVDNPGITPDVPAGVSIIAGGQLGLTGGTINVLDADGTLQFDAVFETNAGSVVNNGHVIFNNGAHLGVGANLTMPTASSSITVGAGRLVEIIHANFNMDGANTVANVITVEANSDLIISTTDYDPDQATNAFDGTITLNGGDIGVTTADAEFVMDGTLNINSTNGNLASWSGEPLDIGNDAGSLDADVNVTGFLFSLAQIGSEIDFNSDADVNVASGGLLQFSSASTVNFDTVNGANNAEFTGTGRLEFNAAVNVNEAVTLNMVGGSVDLDGTDGQGNFINIDAPLVINAATMLSFGKVNGSGVNTLDVNNSAGTGVLTVTLDNPDDEWTLNAAGVMNLVNDNNAATLLAGSDVNLNGTVNVTGDALVNARVDIAGTININTAGEPLRLNGGDNNLDPNTIAGGIIHGPGVLSAEGERALHGFGTINATINFGGGGDLEANDGMLTVNGSIVDVENIGTADADGVLNVVNAWNTNVADSVVLVGGELKGGTVTVGNNNGIEGHGLISAQVINNERLNGSLGTLIVQTPGNGNDWDGAAGDGQLRADSAGTLELRDNATFGFTGTVSAASNSTVFANGFALDFNPGSVLTLTGGKYQSTVSTNIGGTVITTAVGTPTIDVANNSFLTFEPTSATTLNGNLRLVNNNINIDAGATFSGSGALVVPDGSAMVADANANINVLLDNAGVFRPGGFGVVGPVNIKDYQQSSTGELIVDLTGTALNQFDRMLVANQAILDGALQIHITGGFVPALNDVFTILSAPFGVSGMFDLVDIDEITMPANLAFRVNYLPTSVQLQVVTKPIFSADFDEDGDVDATDLTTWKSSFNLNQLGDADGDNDSDGADFLLWQRQFGSAPAVAAMAAVPEPSGILLVGMAAAGIAAVKRRCLAI